MTIYDHRDRPAYRDDFEPYHNRSISEWWSSIHDEAIASLIAKYQWHWYWEVSDAILPLLSSQTHEALTKQRAWRNKIMKFAVTRARELGLDGLIRQAEWKLCPLCRESFIESSLPGPFTRELGLNALDFCSPCLSELVFGEGRRKCSRAAILKFIKGLAKVLQRVPTQEDVFAPIKLSLIAREQRLELLQLLKSKPALRRVKEEFGTWLQALIESGVLASGTRKTSRGTHTLAEDGHVCYSLGEKVIDDFLHRHGVAHEREPRYPGGRYRADFLVAGVLVEYFGLTGDPNYDERTAAKTELCQRDGVKLIAVYPEDIVDEAALSRKILAGVSDEARQPNLDC